MKVIDLLNKIANGEEVPKEIKWKKVKFCYEYNENYEDYVNDLGFSLFRHDDEYTLTDMLNDEVEIIEPQEHKIPKKITMRADIFGDINNKIENLNINQIAIEDKINEIIDYLEGIK